MNHRTHSVVLGAPAHVVFDYVRSPDNLPDWAIHFCRGLEHEDGEVYVDSPQGRLLFRVRAHEASGVIDYFGGPDEDRLACFPGRVIALEQGRALYLLTLFQAPDVPDEAFAQMGRQLDEELAVLARRVSALAAA